MKATKSALALIAVNARRHYAARCGIPCYNPSLGAFYVLRLVSGAPRFLIPTLRTWAVLEKLGKRKATTTVYSGLTLYPARGRGITHDDTTRPRFML